MRTLGIILVVAWTVAAQSETPPVKKQVERTQLDVPKVSFVVPAGWKAEKSRSTMRKGTWRLPGKTDTRVILFWFGNRGAGGLAENVDRWKKQVRTDKKPGIDKLKMAKGLKATVVDISGTYVAPVRPGAKERHEKADHRMLAAYVETPDGPLYLKIVGPEKVVAAARPAAVKWLEGFRYEGRKSTDK